MRRRRAGELPQFDDGADQRVDLERAPRFEVLQHRRLVLAHALRAGDPLFDRMPEHDPELLTDLLRFGHHRSRQLAGLRVAADAG